MADALASGASDGNIVEVQVPFGSPLAIGLCWGTGAIEASVAQLAEQGTENPRVGGSIPS